MCRPHVYFEEWYDPLSSGIRWVSELIELAGGDDCFPEYREGALARERIIADPNEVMRRAPDRPPRRILPAVLARAT